MDKIKIKWMYDTHECDTCGSSYALGAIITMGNTTICMEPVAHCYEGVDYTTDDVYKLILSELGYTVEDEDDD